MIESAFKALVCGESLGLHVYTLTVLKGFRVRIKGYMNFAYCKSVKLFRVFYSRVS